MCGIAGFYGFENKNLIKKFSLELAHRGPDGEGFYVDKKVSLLNRRLAIIDVKTGWQPIYNEDKSVVVVYNGEIYNYLELSRDLEKNNHKFSTKSDTEVIVHGYEQWGKNCFDKFNGMFAVALYDKKKEKLVLARDHFGIKPLYYAFVNKNLIFASEIKPLIYSGLIKKEPNDKIIYRYLHDRVHDHTKETFFAGVYRLMPGEMIEITDKNIQISKYTNLKNELTSLINSKKPVNENSTAVFKEKLVKAIKYRLISEVPVGTCLSGGMDSSTVVAVVNQLLKKHVKESESVGKNQNTFSAVFPGSTNDEEKYIDELISQMSNIKSHKVNPKSEEFFEDIKDFVRTQEEPTISTGPYAQYKVMQKARQFVTVLLDGQGSDEMMAGYLPYYFVYLNELFGTKQYLTWFNEVIKSFDIIFKYFWLKIPYVLGIRKTVNMAGMLNPNFINPAWKSDFKITSNNIKRRLIEDIFANSLQSLLRYEDKNAMRFSIEGRVPFLDLELLKYIFSLKSEAIIKNGWNKYILRQAVLDMLPQSISKRRNKIGFTTPEYEWFMRIKNRIYGIFMSESFIKRKYFNQPEVVKAFKEFIEGKNDDTMVFWRIMNIELWLREFFDQIPAAVQNKDGPIFGAANQGKKVEIKIGSNLFYRFPIRTDLFKQGDDYVKKIADKTINVVNQLVNTQKYRKSTHKKWFVIISEKIIAISQGRSYFIWDIKPNFWANMLSKYVTRTPFGIGLGSPWTMQIAINEVGLPKILLATLVSAITRPFGIRGMFYKIAGSVVRSIDGPTEYSLYPSNVSAKLGPKDPQKVAESIHRSIENGISKTKHMINNFQGVVIIDANDIGRNVLGNSTDFDNTLLEKIMQDNPMGQANEQTPIVLCYY